MTTPCIARKAIQGHPCFGNDGHKKNGRIHLAVAPRCNIQCNFCVRRHDCANESRPGVTSRVQTPDEALERLRATLANPTYSEIIKVVGIAGPGDPLANEATFETFRLVDREYPHLIKCLSTNGLNLPVSLPRLQELDVRSITVTINALDAEVGEEIYSWIHLDGKTYKGREAASILLNNQLLGVAMAAATGMTVKVNTVLIPGVNDSQITKIAEAVRDRGAYIMNVMPLIPLGKFSHLSAPSQEYLEDMRSINEGIINQFKHCRQCRADAVGIPGSDFPVLQQECDSSSCVN